MAPTVHEGRAVLRRSSRKSAMRVGLVTVAIAAALLSPGAAAADDLGWSAQLTLDAPVNHGGNIGSTLHLDAHLDTLALRASVMYGGFSAYEPSGSPGDGTGWIAGGSLLAVTGGVRQVLSTEYFLQPWVAAGLGYGWFWFDELEVQSDYLGIDSHRLAWYGEAGADVVSGWLGMTLSLRALSSPVGMLWIPSLAFFMNLDD